MEDKENYIVKSSGTRLVTRFGVEKDFFGSFISLLIRNGSRKIVFNGENRVIEAHFCRNGHDILLTS